MAVLGHAHSKKFSPDIQRKPSVFQCVPIDSGPVTNDHGKESGCALLAPSLSAISYMHIYCYMHPPEPSFLQTEQPQLSHPFVLVKQRCSCLLITFLVLHRSLCSRSVSLVLETPEWDPALWVWLHQSWVDGRDHILLAIFCPKQTRIPITFAGRAQCWLMFSLLFKKHPGPFLQHYFWDRGSAANAGVWSCYFLGVALSTCHCWISQRSCQPICPVCGSPSGWQHYAVLCQPLLQILCHSRFAGGIHSVPSSRPSLKTLNRASHCIDLWGTSLVIGLQLDLCHWAPPSGWTNHSDNFQPTLLLAHPVCPSSAIKILWGKNVKGLMKHKADNVQCPLLTYQASHFVTEWYQQAGQAWLPLSGSMLSSSDCFLIFHLIEFFFRDKLFHHHQHRGSF